MNRVIWLRRAFTRPVPHQPAIQGISERLFIAVMVGHWPAGRRTRRSQCLLEMAQGQPLLNILRGISLQAVALSAGGGREDDRRTSSLPRRPCRHPGTVAHHRGADRQGPRPPTGHPYETGEPWLARLPKRLRALADLILSDKRTAGEVAYALAALIDRIENAPVNRDYNMYLIDPLNPLKNQ